MLFGLRFLFDLNVLGMLGHMSSRVVLALLDCLRSSHDAAVQFDSRPGLKFLVQKVSRFGVAANLYRQAGVARVVYSHVLLELCTRQDDLSVHKMRQLLTENGGPAADEKHDLSRRGSTSADNMVCYHLLSLICLYFITYTLLKSRNQDSTVQRSTGSA